MLIKLLPVVGVGKILLAGLDGFSSAANYASDKLEHISTDIENGMNKYLRK